ncbi:MAG: FtsX-like permease family protein, partial [bacterium]|nr:FtsX-like permease family protein [bacterium]
LPGYLNDSALDDYEDMYNRVAEEEGVIAAKRWLWLQITKSLLVLVKESFIWRSIMCKNYLKIAFRNILKHKGFSIINISGLAIGMMCSIFIFIYVHYELNYDMFHEDSDRIYRITVDLTYPTGTRNFAGASPSLSPYMKENALQVESISRIMAFEDVQVSYADKIFKEEAKHVVFTEPDLFNIFTFSFKYGDPTVALSRPGTVVLTDKTAKKYFGEENPMGRTINIGGEDYEITGITEDLPSNTFLEFNILRSWKTLGNDEHLSRWFGIYVQTFVKLAPESDPDLFAQLCSQTVYDNAKEILVSRNAEYKCQLQPLERMHLYSNYIWDIVTPGNVIYIYILSGIGVFILLIAGINFMNLSTARSGNRACEVGMRKVAGADRKQLFMQFAGESLLTTFISFTIAVTAVVFLMEFYNQFTLQEIGYFYLLKSELLIGMGLVVIFLGLAAGGYPAVFLSSFKPVTILRRKSVIGFKGGRMRKVLVIGQFALSIAMISGTIFFNQQLNYMKNTPLGFDKEQKLIVSIAGTGLNLGNYQSIKEEFNKIHSVNGTALSSSIPGRGTFNWRIWSTGEKEINAHLLSVMAVDEDFLSLYGINIFRGNGFGDKTLSSQVSSGWILNETAVSTFGWNSAEEAVAKTLMDNSPATAISGVFRDYHFDGLQNIIEPQGIYLGWENMKYLTLNIDANDPGETILLVENQFNTLFPGSVFEYFFLDDDFAAQYTGEDKISSILKIFTILGILIACLGLFGLAAFMAELRTKEIGIRKTLGASTGSVVHLLSREFLYLVLTANLIACPLSYYVIYKWLQGFAYKMDIEVMTFLAAGFIAVLIALVSVSYQSLKAALADPVNSLRYE